MNGIGGLTIRIGRDDSAIVKDKRHVVKSLKNRYGTSSVSVAEDRFPGLWRARVGGGHVRAIMGTRGVLQSVETKPHN